MKHMISACLTTLLITIATASAQTPQVWVDAASRTVNFAPQPVVTVQLIPLEADDTVWAQLNVSIDYPASSLEAQGALAQARQPSYTVRRSVLRPNGPFTVNIPALHRTESVTALPGTVGPYFNYPLLLSRRESTVLQRNWGADVVTVTGRATAHVNATTPLETVSLDNSYCQRLATGTLYDVITSFGTFSTEIDRMSSIRYASTRQALKRSLLEDCLDIPGGTASDMAAFLALTVRPRAGARPTGVTYSEGPSAVTMTFSPQHIVLPLTE